MVVCCCSFVDCDVCFRVAAAFRFRRRLVAFRCIVCKIVLMCSLSIYMVYMFNYLVVCCSFYVVVC